MVTYIYNNDLNFLQRLKPGDPILSFRQCERQTFSMRPDREVRYCITVQQTDAGDHSMLTTGIVSQKFGLGDKSSKSEVSNSRSWGTVLLSNSWTLRTTACSPQGSCPRNLDSAINPVKVRYVFDVHYYLSKGYKTVYLLFALQAGTYTLKIKFGEIK